MLDKRKRILISAGGTGGHVFPAQALAQQFSKLCPAPEIMFAAGGLSNNRYFDRSRFAFKEVRCGALTKNPLKLIENSAGILKGIFQSFQIINKFKPHAVVGFGSFYTIPVLIAAKLKGIPIILHEANSVPGKANKWFAPFAACIGVNFPFASSLLKGEVFEVGIPLREGYINSRVDRQKAKEYFHLSSMPHTLLVFGGSQGAKAINDLMREAIPYLGGVPLQFIHLIGPEEKEESLLAIYNQHSLPVCIKPFEKNMHLAWKAADFFIGRSGASTIGEAMEFEVPGILIPYPFATDNHQEHNADFFVDNVKGGVKILQQGLSGAKLADGIISLLSGLELRKKAIQSYKKIPRLDLCQLILKAIKE